MLNCSVVLLTESIALLLRNSYEQTPKSFGVKLGTYDYRDDDEDGEQLRDVVEIHVHPQFGKPHPFSYDISLLRLSSPVNFTDHIQPVCVSKAMMTMNDNQTGYVTGWGVTSEGGTASTKLRQVIVPFLSPKECEAEYKGEIDETMTCAGRKGIDSCQGDSGGPLVVKHKDSKRWYQAGIVSWGHGCGEAKHAGTENYGSPLKIPASRFNVYTSDLEREERKSDLRAPELGEVQDSYAQLEYAVLIS
ncbi:unnamed protein product [Haemonchus placei]|uniref:Peptidase S1 domain-containing protein n=1 Tax=Haemonchus placei TaxID=6290 RepID=A0A0N4W519_HAEPC|nr:unnamed protein product [Haemonchus placei]